MKKVVFYFSDGDYLSFYGYGRTEQECIRDAEKYLNQWQREEVCSISVYEPMPTEY
jgi:hypothetical protein